MALEAKIFSITLFYNVHSAPSSAVMGTITLNPDLTARMQPEAEDLGPGMSDLVGGPWLRSYLNHQRGKLKQRQ